MSAKNLSVLLLGVVFSFSVSAATNDTSIGGGTTPAEITGYQEILRPVTRYEDYETTCSREVYGGTRTVCSEGRTETRCRKVAGVGEECWEVETGGSCSEEPYYETEYYSCTQTRAYTSYEHDYDVFAKIFITKKDSANDYDLSKCLLGVKLADSSETFYAECGEAIVRAKVLSRTESKKDGDKYRDIKVELDFASIEGLSALKAGLSELSFNKGVASFYSADLSSASNFKLSAKLVRNRFLLKDKVLLERELKASDYKVEVQGNGTFKVSVDLAKLTGFDSTKKHTFSVELKTVKSVDVAGAINDPELKNSCSQKLVINE